MLEPGARCLIVEDVVTTGGSTVKAIERVLEEGFEVAGVLSVVDRLAGGGEAIAEAAGAPLTAPWSRSTTSIPIAPIASSSQAHTRAARYLDRRARRAHETPARNRQTQIQP